MNWTHWVLLGIILATAGALGFMQLVHGPVNALHTRIASKLKDKAYEFTGSSDEFEYVVRAVHSRDADKLRAFDKNLLAFHCQTIHVTVDAMRRTSGNRRVSGVVTARELEAVQTINRAHDETVTALTPQRDWGSVQEWAVTHPDDATVMAQVIRRGIFSLSQIIEMMEVFKEAPAEALSEGAL